VTETAKNNLTNEILTFWFGSGDDEVRDIWFKKDDTFDQEIRERFGTARQTAAAGGHDDWANTADGALALVILLDQFSRNLCRGSADAFATDEKSLSIAKAAIDNGFDLAQHPIRRGFFYLPFEHSENLAEQVRSIELFTALGNEHTLKYAVEHHDIIERFGRFPHRNAVLGRESTAEEQAFLETFDSF
jgi:uncharacterized protein (DUF924 family)